MNPGSLVRFKRALIPPISARPWLIGLLVEYDPINKLTVIMYENELYNIPISDVQRYGRRYLEATG